MVSFVNTKQKLRSRADVKTVLNPILEKAGVIKAIVFGSYARDTATPRSDLDLIIIMKTKERFFKRYDQIDEVYKALEGIAVEILIYTPEELKKISHRPFIQKALSEGQVIYER
jgi:predicted nucleotidyltransferase